MYIEPEGQSWSRKESRISKNLFRRQSQKTELEYLLNNNNNNNSNDNEGLPMRKMNRFRTEMNTMIMPADFSIINSIRSMRRMT